MTLESLNILIKSETIWLYIAELMSADNNLTKENCIKHIKLFNELLNISNQLENKETRDTIIKYSTEGINILNQNIKELE